MEKRERPEHCLIGNDYIEEKCKDIRCKLKALCRRLKKRENFF